MSPSAHRHTVPVWFVAALATLAVCAGCRTAPPRPGPPGLTPAAVTGELALTSQELEFASALAHYGQGLIYQSQDKWASTYAVDEFLKAIERDPHQTHLYSKVALLYLCQKKQAEAIAILEKSCVANPGSPNPLIDLAVTYEIAGQPLQAIERYERAIRLTPAMSSLYCQVANMYIRQQNDKDALRTLAEGVRVSADPLAVLTFAYGAGVKHIAAERPDRAEPFLQFVARSRVPQGDEVRRTAYLHMANLHIKTAPERAAATLLQATKEMPNDPELLSALGLTYSAADKYDQAIPVLLQAGRAAGTNQLTAAYYLHLGAAYERSGQFADAERAFLTCIEQYPETHAVLNYLAYMWAERGQNLDRAEGFITRALRLSPENGAYIDTLGWIQYQKKNYESALQNLMRASLLVGDDAVIADHLGDVYCALKNIDKAVQWWKRSYGLDPKNKDLARKLEARGVNLKEIPPVTPSSGKGTSAPRT